MDLSLNGFKGINMSNKLKLIAVASAGGHFVQLCRLRPAFIEHDVLYVSTSSDKFSEEDLHAFVNDANFSDKIGILRMAYKVFRIIIKFRPDVVISTGAAVGFFAIFFSKVLFGAKTVWIDSIANVEKISLAGRFARPWSDHWCTQWEHLSKKSGAEFLGAVL